MSVYQYQVEDELFSIFTGMASKLTQSFTSWPVNLNLPLPAGLPIEPSKDPLKELETKRKSKIITACPHVQRKHYAKNMCNNCYHKTGRNKNAWECDHKDRKHYAKGFCQMCYLKFYNSNKAKAIRS